MPNEENVKILVANSVAMLQAEDAINNARDALYAASPEYKALADASKARADLIDEINDSAPEHQPEFEDYLEALDKVAEQNPQWADQVRISREQIVKRYEESQRQQAELEAYVKSLEDQAAAEDENTPDAAKN